MKFQMLRPMLWTAELDETIIFYTDILGFTCDERNDTWGWAALHRDSVEVMLARPNEHTPLQKPIFTGSFYITVDDADSIWHELKDKARICYPIENFEWQMREFAIFDNNGYIIQFGQDLSSK